MGLAERGPVCCRSAPRLIVGWVLPWLRMVRMVSGWGCHRGLKVGLQQARQLPPLQRAADADGERARGTCVPHHQVGPNMRPLPLPLPCSRGRLGLMQGLAAAAAWSDLRRSISCGVSCAVKELRARVQDARSMPLRAAVAPPPSLPLLRQGRLGVTGASFASTPAQGVSRRVHHPTIPIACMRL